MKHMPIFSDDDSCDDVDSKPSEQIKHRKSKPISFNNYFNNDEDSDYEEPQHDSDNDPDFKYSDNETSSSENEVSSHRANDDFDDTFSMMSDVTEINKTLDMLFLPRDSVNISGIDVADDNVTSHKKESKQKVSEACETILGKIRCAQWLGNCDTEVASQQCYDLIKLYPQYHGSYDVLSLIYEKKGEFKKANQVKYLAAMFDKKNIDRWIQLIEQTKDVEGIDSAIHITKLAVSHTMSHALREVLVKLLQEGGYEKGALSKRLVNLNALPRATKQDDIEKEVEELFYMSEKFEAMNDIARASECLEILNKKYHEYLTNEKLMNLLMVLIKLRRFNKVLAVSENIDGIHINMHNMSRSSDLIVISDRISDEHRYDIIYALLMAILHLKMPAAVRHRSFNEHLHQLDAFPDHLISILGKLFNFEFYEMVIENCQRILDKSNEKVVLLKLIGKSQEKLNQNDEALQTYDHIINEINGRDPSVWELKANLLYSLKREQDAIDVLAESQKFVHDQVEENHLGKLIRKPKPTRESAQLLYKLCRLLEKENRMEEYIKVAWKYIFIDSYEYFKINKIKLFCEDMAVAKSHFYDITDSLWICISKTTEILYGENAIFISSHAKPPYENEAWNILDNMLNLLMRSPKANMEYIEMLSQWGLFLQRSLNWNQIKREKLSSIYISTAIINRVHNPLLRSKCSTQQILAELRNWRIKLGESIQYWNLFNLYCHLVGNCNNRHVLRSIQQTKNSYLPELINAGYVVSNNTKLSLAVNGKVHFEHPENAQVCLQLAITFINAAMSRTCEDYQKTSMLAINFMSKYREARGDCQETWYNLGRFYHKICFTEYAMACYEKCLATPPIGNNDRERSMTDLTMNAAYNLISIYKERNNKPMCAFLTQKYLTI